MQNKYIRLRHEHVFHLSTGISAADAQKVTNS